MSIETLIEGYVLGEASLRQTYDKAGKEAKKNFEDPRAAKKVIIDLAKRSHWVYDFMKKLSTNLERSKRGSAAAGAFPHEPNRKVTKMYDDLLNLFVDVRTALKRKGFASDERNDRMQEMLQRVQKGDLLQRETAKKLLRKMY